MRKPPPPVIGSHLIAESMDNTGQRVQIAIMSLQYFAVLMIDNLQCLTACGNVKLSSLSSSYSSNVNACIFPLGYISFDDIASPKSKVEFTISFMPFGKTKLICDRHLSAAMSASFDDQRFDPFD